MSRLSSRGLDTAVRLAIPAAPPAQALVRHCITACCAGEHFFLAVWHMDPKHASELMRVSVDNAGAMPPGMAEALGGDTDMPEGFDQWDDGADE